MCGAPARKISDEPVRTIFQAGASSYSRQQKTSDWRFLLISNEVISKVRKLTVETRGWAVMEQALDITAYERLKHTKAKAGRTSRNRRRIHLLRGPRHPGGCEMSARSRFYESE
jgi:hypothetical protein